MNPPSRRSIIDRHRRPHPAWLWVAAVLALLLALVMWSFSAAAQNQRGMQTIKAAMSLQPDVRKGKVLYARQCASCHGGRGHGMEDSLTPALAGQVPVYTIKQLVDAGEGDRRISAMHRTLANQQLESPTALANVAGYIATLRVNTRATTGSGKNLVQGIKIYAATCVQCHGSDGGGKPQWLTPSLRGQHYSYLLTQMRQIATSHRYAVEPAVIELLEALSLEQVTGVADLASRLSNPRSLPSGALPPED
jgi:cytochrome c553